MSRGNIYISIKYISIVSASHYPVTLSQNHNQLLKHLLFAFNIFLTRFLYISVLWEVSTGDAVMTKLFYQSLCHVFLYMAAIMI